MIKNTKIGQLVFNALNKQNPFTSTIKTWNFQFSGINDNKS